MEYPSNLPNTKEQFKLSVLRNFDDYLFLTGRAFMKEAEYFTEGKLYTKWSEHFDKNHTGDFEMLDLPLYDDLQEAFCTGITSTAGMDMWKNCEIEL